MKRQDLGIGKYLGKPVNSKTDDYIILLDSGQLYNVQVLECETNVNDKGLLSYNLNDNGGYFSFKSY